MNPSTALARVFVDELARCGVSEVVISPGSRSTPLALAFFDHEAIRLHVRIDERSASFLALGLAKASGKPVPVVCTSGTAAANLYPAALEAYHSGVPLILFTADRAPELRQTGSNQTVDQLKLFGGAVRSFTEVGVAEEREGAVAYWRSTIGRAVAQALDIRTGGPVHVNVAFRKPFLPDDDPLWPESLAGRPSGAPWISLSRPQLRPVNVEAPARGVLLLGDGAPDPVAALRFAQQAGWPVIAEPTSGARYGEQALSSAAYLLQVPEFTARHCPDLVITAGKVSLSQGEQELGALALIRSAKRHVVVDPSDQWPDPVRSADEVIPALGDPINAAPSPAWLSSWLAADATARRVVDAIVDADEHPSEPRLARDMVAALAEDSLLVIGASMPIRDVDATMLPRRGPHMLTNRGVSGIDGVVSTAIGAALAHQRAGGGGAYALLGDLTLLHDQNGLVLGPDEPLPDLTIVVVNNNGGALFSVLPQAGVGPAFERLFGTPHNADLSYLAAAAGVPYTRLEAMSELPALLKVAPGAGLRLIEVRTDRAANATLHNRLLQAVSAEFAGEQAVAVGS